MPDIMQSPITVFDSSSAAAILEQKTRWTELCASFEKRYGKKPDYIARAPGRVSIIGEHIDYAGRCLAVCARAGLPLWKRSC